MTITYIGNEIDKNFMVDFAFEHGVIEDYDETYARTHIGKISLEALYYLRRKGL
jgi:hypothetical protein